MLLDVDPTVDYAFKHLFGRETTRPLLVNLLNEVLAPAPGHDIDEIDLLNPFNPKEAPDDKLSILDIKARDRSGRQFNIEMQVLAFPYYEKRILYYACKLHQQQLREGQDYLELRPTISISFLNHVLFPHLPDHHLRFNLTEAAGRVRLTDDMEFHILELPKFSKSVAELTTGLDFWLYFLRNAEKIDIENVPIALQRPMVMRALEELRMLSQTDLEREHYEARRKFQLDYNTGLKVARLEGIEEGRQDGIQEGKAIGEKIGVIHLCERLLKRQETPMTQLAALSITELNAFAEELQAQVLREKTP